MDKWIAVIAAFVFECVCLVNSKITIKELRVPETIVNEENKAVILDCDYELKDEEGLEVKWFYNGTNQIYQWVPHLSHPQALGSFRGKIDTTYKRTNDSNTEYRALRLKEISPKLSGNYTCKVSGNYGEDEKTKRMVIYEPAKSFTFFQVENEDTVICSAHEISPKPLITITAEYISSNETVPNMEEDQEVEVSQDDIYNVTEIHKFDKDSIKGPVKFTCTLTIPATEYLLTKSFDLYTGVGERILKPTVWILFLIVSALFSIQ